LPSAIKGAGSIEAVRELLEKKIDQLAKDPRVKVSFDEAIMIGNLIGRLRVATKGDKEGKFSDSVEFADDFQLTPTEFIEAWKKTPGYNEKIYKKLLVDVDKRSAAAGKDLIDELKRRLQTLTADAIANNDYDGFVSSVKELVDVNDSYLRLAYDTNVSVAQSAGNKDQIMDMVEERPYVQYIAYGANMCDDCATLDEKVFRADNPQTWKVMPIRHFGCQCSFVSLDEFSGRVDDPGRYPPSQLKW
jgi:hypothetical protein